MGGYGINPQRRIELIREIVRLEELAAHYRRRSTLATTDAGASFYLDLAREAASRIPALRTELDHLPQRLDPAA